MSRQPLPDDGTLWTQEDAARFAKCSVRTVQRTPIPRVPGLGRLVRYDPATVRAYFRDSFQQVGLGRLRKSA
jgi:hypothetical protein